MSSQDPRVEAIFHEALERAPAERESFVAEACGGDESLRLELQRLLAAHNDAGTYFETPNTPEIEAELARLKPEEASESIGPYKLLEQIGEGGFGAVWIAEQKVPVRRRVALKILKLGMDTKEVLARFEQERQALALMDHPSIAKVFDAGATQHGRPFIVMELVNGVKITEFCDGRNLAMRERLELFMAICQAVQHAHQKGVIHRDLKPSNILVTLQDGVPVPKIIDFGVAKAVQQRLSDLTVYTQIEQMIGTPPYMSPEQAEASALNVDTRTDIYALGVLLYELLTGRTPFDAATLMKASYEEMRRIIREQEPPKPSTALHTMAANALTDVARHRQSEPPTLIHAVRGDLDWIVMKALEKDRARRYETANGFALDVQRHLRSEPVIARPPSGTYRFGRLVRRNRLTFAAAGAVAAALVIGLSVATVSLFKERTARAGEAEQRKLADEQRRQAQASADEARKSEYKAEHFLYAADMNLVQQALRTNNVGSARLLLDRHRPENGEPDLRGWEWRYLWQECRSGAQVMLTKREGVPVFSADFSPDGTQLLVGYWDGQVELWDIPARQRLKVVQSPINQRGHVAFSPRGESFAATMGVGVVKAVNVKTGAEALLCTAKGEIRDLSYSRDGEWLAVLTRGDLAMILRADGGGSVMNYPLPPGSGVFFNNVRISPDKQRLYVSCGAFGEPRVRCVSIPDARLLWEVPIGIIEDGETDSRSDTGFTAMDLSRDGHTLVVATGLSDRQIRVLDAENGNLLKKLAGHTGYILQLAFSKDGQVLASSSEDQTVRLWETATWTRLKAPLRGHNHEVNAIAFSNDGRTLASGNKDGEVLLWDAQAPRLPNGRHALPSHIRSVIALPVRRMVLGRTVDGKWSLIDLLTLTEEPLPAAEVPATGQYPRLVPMSRRQPARRLNPAQLGLSGLLNTFALSPDGKMLAVASDSGQIGLYDAATLAPIDVVRSSLGAVFGVAFSPDNQRLVLGAGGESGIVIWDLVTRQELLTLSSPHKLLYAVEFADDGNTLLAGSQQTGRNDAGSCQFWQAPSLAEIEEAERTGGLWPQTTAFLSPPPPLTLAETKNLIEQGYRDKLAASRARSPKDPAIRDESLTNLAGILIQQGRNAEAEPLVRERLESLSQQNPRDDQAVLAATTDLIGIVFSLARSEREAGHNAKAAGYIQQANALVGNVLPLLDQSAVRNPQDMLLSLKVAALQVWLGKKPDYIATRQRVLKLAESSNDPNYIEAAAKLCCLQPSSDPGVLDTALALARKAKSSGKRADNISWFQLTLGMVEYRQGNYEAADQTLRAAEQAGSETFSVDHVRGTAGFFRAMTLFRLRKVPEALQSFTRAKAKMKPLPTNDQILTAGSAGHNDLVLWLAYKEAKEVIRPEIQDVGWEQALKRAEETVEESRKAKGAGARETLELSRRLAETFDAAGHPDEALRALAQTSIDAPDDMLLANEVAALQVWLGKSEDYLATCRRTLAFAETTTNDPTRSQRIAAKISCLGVHGDSALQNRALTLIQRAVTAPDAPVSLSQHILGMVEFRAGNYEAAEKALVMAQKASTSENQHIKGPVELFRAMILFRRGNQTEARNLFAEAEAQMKPLPEEKRGVIPLGANRDDLQFWLAYEEARALLQPK